MFTANNRLALGINNGDNGNNPCQRGRGLSMRRVS